MLTPKKSCFENYATSPHFFVAAPARMGILGVDRRSMKARRFFIGGMYLETIDETAGKTGRQEGKGSNGQSSKPMNLLRPSRLLAERVTPGLNQRKVPILVKIVSECL